MNVEKKVKGKREGGLEGKRGREEGRRRKEGERINDHMD